MIVGVLTTCHLVLQMQHRVISFMELRQVGSTYSNLQILKGFMSSGTYRVIQNNFRGHTQYMPDATPCDFFLWGYVKGQVYVPPLPASNPELKVRIRTAIQTITADMQQKVWNVLDYRVDVCRITKGAHIEQLYGM